MYNGSCVCARARASETEAFWLINQWQFARKKQCLPLKKHKPASDEKKRPCRAVRGGDIGISRALFVIIRRWDALIISGKVCICMRSINSGGSFTARLVKISDSIYTRVRSRYIYIALILYIPSHFCLFYLHPQQRVRCTSIALY